MSVASFFIIGAAKAGTTSIHEILRHHPSICFSMKKEPEFFARNELYERGINFYHEQFRQRRNGQICGEASTLYSNLRSFPDTPERIATYNPDAKIIFIMREPVSRAFSYYQQLLKNWQRANRSSKVRRTFDDCLFGDREKICHRNDIFAPFDSHLPDTPELFIGGGEYLYTIEKYQNYFDKSRFLFLTFEEFVENTNAVIRKICNFLEIEQLSESVITYSKPKNQSFSHYQDLQVQQAAHGLKEKFPALYFIRQIFPKKIRQKILKNIITKNFLDSGAGEVRPVMTEQARQFLYERYMRDVDRLEAITNLKLRQLWKMFDPAEPTEPNSQMPHHG